jgi:hypothetical protein
MKKWNKRDSSWRIKENEVKEAIDWIIRIWGLGGIAKILFDLLVGLFS